MGQKVNPTGIRIGNSLPGSFNSVFFAEKEYARWLLDDYNIRKKIKNEYAKAQISKIIIQRLSEKNIKIAIFAFKPKLIIGENGSVVDKIKLEIQKSFKLEEVIINVNHVHKPNLEASIVAYNIAKQIENYVPFRLAMKKAIEETMKQNARGIKVKCSGRLGGAEIARTEGYKEGRVPLHTLRADIDYAQHNAKTKYGIIGIKVWIYRDNTLSNRKINI
jgi:small subunit ribosomal protein S3